MALAGSPVLAGLTRLELRGNDLTSAGADALLASPHLRGLVELDLRRNAIGQTVADCLRQRFGAGVRV